MTKRKQQRLRQILGRDTRVIHSLLNIIKENENILLRGKQKKRIDDSKIHSLTMTAVRVTDSSKQRLSVPHDLKSRFPRISANELAECRLTAVENYESYLSLRSKKGHKTSRPCYINKLGRIPRKVYIPYRAKVVEHHTTIACWWLDLRDSLDSAPQGCRTHERLRIPLKTSPFHLQQLERGKAKSAQIFKDRHGKWWVSIAIKLSNVEPLNQHNLPFAVLGIDLGINRAACTTLLLPTRVSETRYFVQKDKVAIIENYDKQVAELQHKLDTLRNQGNRYDQVKAKLTRISSKRENVSKEYDKVLVRDLIDYITRLDEKYTVYVAIGQLKGIRWKARKGDGQGRKLRGKMHRWTFSRITRFLKHGLTKLGWKVEGKDARVQDGDIVTFRFNI